MARMEQVAGMAGIVELWDADFVFSMLPPLSSAM